MSDNQSVWYSQHNAGDLAEILRIAAEFQRHRRGKDYTGRQVVFRGASNQDYALEPGLLREPFVDSASLKYDESQLLREFKQRGAPYIPARDISTRQLMCLMQHHGAPTRLLDWTESVMTAVYFALGKTRFEEASADACVWCLDAEALIQRGINAAVDEDIWSMPFDGHIDPVGRVLDCLFRNYDYEAEDSWKRLYSRLAPFPMWEESVTPRMVAQAGLFTVHSFVAGDMARACANAGEGRGAPLLRISIKKADVPEIFRQLVGVGGGREAQMWPDLDGVAKDVTNELRDRIRVLDSMAFE